MKKIFLIITLISTIFAELPPYVYEKAKNSSEEKLKIKVLDVSTHDIDNTRYINILAKVVDIQRSQSNIEKDSNIVIKYDRVIKREIGWVGPSQNYELKKDKEYIVYLKKTSKGDFIPDAMGKSFELAKYNNDFISKPYITIDKIEVDPITGALDITIDEKYTSNKKNKIKILRRYNSHTTYQGLLGRGWFFDFEIKIVKFKRNNLVVFLPHIAKEVSFKQVSKEQWNYANNTIIKKDDYYILIGNNKKDIVKFDLKGNVVYKKQSNQELYYTYTTKYNNTITIKNDYNKTIKISYTNNYISLKELNSKENITYMLDKNLLSYISITTKTNHYINLLGYDTNQRLSYIDLNSNFFYDKYNRIVEISTYNINKSFSYSKVSQ